MGPDAPGPGRPSLQQGLGVGLGRVPGGVVSSGHPETVAGLSRVAALHAPLQGPGRGWLAQGQG